MTTAMESRWDGTHIITMKEMEKLHLEYAFKVCKGNRTHIAKALGISIRTVRIKIEEYCLRDVECDKFREQDAQCLKDETDQNMFQNPELEGELAAQFLDGESLNRKMKDIELAIMLVALKRSNGCKAEAARLLGLNRTTLCMKLKSNGLTVADDQAEPMQVAQ